MKCLVTAELVAGPTFVTFFTFHLKRKIRLERKCLSAQVFAERLKSVARVLRMDIPASIIHRSVTHHQWWNGAYGPSGFCSPSIVYAIMFFISFDFVISVKSSHPSSHAYLLAVPRGQ